MRRLWTGNPGEKTLSYVGAFFDTVIVSSKITGKVTGNHGVYTVSAEMVDKMLVSACSCYIGKGGYCHHCEALVLTYLQEPASFTEISMKKREDVHKVGDLHSYLQGVTLEALLKQLSDRKITQKAMAEGLGMNPRHLSMLKSAEARNRPANELGATKLACLWLLEHADEFKGA